MKMKLQPSIVLLLLLVAVRLPSASSDDQLVLGKPLSPSTTIISDGGAFALGFFSPSNSTTSASSRDGLYLGIWYSGITELTVVWVANRESPIVTIPRRPPSASTPSGPTLALTNDSNLVLTDADGRVVWATDVVVAAAHTPGVAVLTNAGNLVLRSPNGTTLWQSFDHPTDTFLPGMKIRIARPGPFLVSWKGPGDPAPGRFAYGIDPSTSLQLFTWNGSRPMWRSGAWTGYSVASEYVASASAVVSLAVVDTDEDSYVAFALSDAAPRTRYVITHSGSLELQSWKSGGAGWHTLGRWPPHDCSRYDYCGPFGYCDNTDAPPACKCLPGFEPASPDEWRSGRFLLGCRRKEELRCGVSNGDGEGFLAVPDMKVPDRFVVIANTGATGCAAECARNCSCVAYAHANLSSSSRGDATRCLVWLGDLIDAKKLGGSAAASDTLHLRVPGVSTAGRKKERNKMKIVLPVIAGVVLVLACLSIVIWACKSKGSKQKHNNFNRLIGLGDLSTCEGFGTGSPNEGFEFSLLSFRDIAALTNNFHTSHMIGQGGFGKVYKAVLDGREVAIKRLSRNSDQGMTEFRNEVVLIAKLQHRNLVSLVGCCSEGDEKLLIYEYMPNKSLDALLFNNSGETMLDWPTRFRIIKGVAKGLLYLHQDSRLKIIHRDLKASNVLLDEEMRPKIADFGMARMFGENQQKADTKRVVGTYGYMAPEYAMRGIFSTKSDVYSFGVLTLEVVSGVKISSTDRTMEFENLIAYAWNLWKDRKTNDLVDSNIVGTCVHDEALLCVQMGLLCVQDNPNDRPTMSYVMFILENISATLPIPNQPVFFAHTNNQVENVTGDTQNSKNNLTLTILEGR
uniref:Receptor-like serine/threonine-protein kinase n=1 Tax=Hordeum vulgare subsp. vulgare TaxID=112509 RepID=F2DVF8_HORVV|nr:predicted protein [Hordeum vulgare subsp. vulgare]